MPLHDEKEPKLDETLSIAIKRFPKIFDTRLNRGLHQLLGNTSEEFIEARCFPHLRHLLLTQFFLQKQVEEVLLKGEAKNRQVFLRLFYASSRICLALTLSLKRDHEIFSDTHILSAFKNLLPGIKVVPHSFYTWQSKKLSYLFCYIF